MLLLATLYAVDASPVAVSMKPRSAANATLLGLPSVCGVCKDIIGKVVNTIADSTLGCSDDTIVC